MSKLKLFITTTIRNYLNEGKTQSNNSNLSPELWDLVNSEYFMKWSNNWSNVLLDENKEPAIFYRGISLFSGDEVKWKFNKSFFTRNKSYAQIYAQNHDDGSFNKDLVFSFFLRSKNTFFVDDYGDWMNIDSDSINGRIQYRILGDSMIEYLYKEMEGL